MALTRHKNGTMEMTAQGDSISEKVKVRFFRWVGANAAGHSLVVDDGIGGLVWESEADGANFIDIHPAFAWYNGITATTMQSGKLIFWVM